MTAPAKKSQVQPFFFLLGRDGGRERQQAAGSQNHSPAGQPVRAWSPTAPPSSPLLTYLLLLCTVLWLAEKGEHEGEPTHEEDRGHAARYIAQHSFKASISLLVQKE